MAQFLAPIINDQQEDANGAPLDGGTVSVYLAGSSTPATTYSDKAGLVPNTWPITLNTLGLNQQGAVWITGGAAYKFVIKDAAGVTLRTIDNVSGVNDATITNDQWIPYQAAPAYISATSFSVVGDQTQTFQIYRRVKTKNTGGVVYGTITASTYSSPNTTVTVRNDSGTLDSGLSQVSYGIISALDSSLLFSTLLGSPGYQRLPSGVIVQWGTSVQTLSAGGGGTVTYGTPFVNSTMTVLAVNGDPAGTVVAPSINGFNNTNFGVLYSGVGAVVVRINWIAVGL